MAYRMTTEQEAILQEIRRQGENLFSFQYPGETERFVICLGRIYVVGRPHEILITWNMAREWANKGESVMLSSRRYFFLDYLPPGMFHLIWDAAYSYDIDAEIWLKICDWADEYMLDFYRENRGEIMAYKAKLESEIETEKETQRAKRVKRATRRSAWSEAAQGVKVNKTPLGQLAALGIIA